MRKLTLALLAFTITLTANIALGAHPVEASHITQRSVVREVNRFRTKQNLKALKVSPVLTIAAQTKADDMAKRNYFAHVDPDGNKVYKIIQSLNYSYWVAGENLALDYNKISPMTKAWMESATHRANILNSSFTETGIGIAKVNDGRWEHIYVVQLFALPK